MERRLVCAVEDVPKGTSITVQGDEPIAVYHTDDDGFHATADTCTHEKWSLGSDSDVEGTEVTCPLHMARFDIKTGAPLCFPATVALRTYPVEIDDGQVYIRI
ncbi:non-heme iron oxygenase ferredoxin subunit [Nocardia vinacea]|uniref:Non-heme iron oxygenase ferredoxin subunit n=1 Tax=Nocardia vinacea TaxID=96468 RepID=A0ABZ1YTB0_9NOCA|nr:non-heme iron oxygenase ferredoxin subunit [Nocardia vinacea]